MMIAPRAQPLMLLAVLAAGCASTGDAERRAEAHASEPLAAASVIAGWPPDSELAARRLLLQYGAPDEVHADWLAWNGNRPWKRTVVRIVSPLGTGDRGIIEQSVERRLTARQAALVLAFDPRLSYDRKSTDLAARSDREEANFLRLNLAGDIAAGRMTAAQARALAAQIMRLDAAGKSSSYLHVLHFQP